MVFVLGACLLGWDALPAAGQETDTVFRRFDSGLQVAKIWQRSIEVPVYLRPQTDPDSEIVSNTGLNYVVSYRPENRIYFSRSFGYAKMEWEPKDGDVNSVRVIQFDITEIVNFTLFHTVVVNFGLGLGFMDGLTIMRDGRYQTRLEPFIPIQMGLALPLGGTFVMSVKGVQSSYFWPGPVVSAFRGLVGFGYNY